MTNLNNLKKLIKKYALSRSEKDAGMLIMYISHNCSGIDVLMVLSKEERAIIKEACTPSETIELQKVI